MITLVNGMVGTKFFHLENADSASIESIKKQNPHLSESCIDAIFRHINAFEDFDSESSYYISYQNGFEIRSESVILKYFQ